LTRFRGRFSTFKYPALARVGVAAKDGANPMEQHAEELQGVRASLSE
jgi:hypothetical protein